MAENPECKDGVVIFFEDRNTSSSHLIVKRHLRPPSIFRIMVPLTTGSICMNWTGNTKFPHVSVYTVNMEFVAGQLRLCVNKKLAIFLWSCIQYMTIYKANSVNLDRILSTDVSS